MDSNYTFITIQVLMKYFIVCIHNRNIIFAMDQIYADLNQLPENTKPFPEPIQTYCQFYLHEQNPMKFVP